MRTSRLVAVLAVLAAGAGMAVPCQADDYPSRPVRIIVGFIPGSAADITARVFGERMGQILGQQFVVETKPGAGSSLAAEFVARAPKDGYTLFLASSANITNAAINPNLSFDMAKDFAPIAMVDTAAIMLVVRMKALGVGWLMQNAMYFGGEAFLRERGNEVMRLTPPLRSAQNVGVKIGGGTDAHRVMSYNPLVSLEWTVDGKTVAGMATRGADELASREEALRFYTLGSAWFTHDDGRRGSIETGKLADLAVLSRDYMGVPTGEIGGIESLLTMVGGRIVYGAGPYASLEERAR